MKQLKPRDKITQKMTRDGAVEINETQQTAERISSREADSDFSQPDTATAERVMEHLDAAHTRKASKKAVKKAQEAAVLRTSTSRLQFTDEERETPKLQPYIKKSEKAADKLDAAKAALPKQKKLVKERTFEETTGKAKTRLRFEEQEKPIPGGKAHSNPLSHPAQEAGIFVHNKIHSVEKDNSGVEGAHKSEELAERGARYGTRKLKQARGFAGFSNCCIYHGVCALGPQFVVAIVGRGQKIAVAGHQCAERRTARFKFCRGSGIHHTALIQHHNPAG